MLNFGQKKGTGVQPVQQRFKIEKIKTEKKPPPLKSKQSSNDVRAKMDANMPMRGRLAVPSPANGVGTKRKDRGDSGGRSITRKSPNIVARRSPSQIRLESDSESDEEVGRLESKRAKVQNGDIDVKRRLRNRPAFRSERDEIIHASQSTLTKRRAKSGEKSGSSAGVSVTLNFPSLAKPERYQLTSEGDVIFVGIKDMIDPFDEIKDIAEVVSNEYLTEEQREEFAKIPDGIIRKLQKATNNITSAKKPFDKADIKDKLFEFKGAVNAYNDAIGRRVKDGSIAKNLDNMRSLPPKLVKMILHQVYDRAISPTVELLQKYENGTSYVYGEMLFSFISRILTEDTRMKSDQVFVDLGSGVGNVVIQAALQIGCESWGCEFMPNASKLAKKQKEEFAARCAAWGLNTGSVNLESGDFLENTNIHKAMARADVIVVNNQVFLPELNQSLLNLFLDLKDGCKIVSLQSFVPDGHEINARNLNNPVNLLRVEKKFFAVGEVSWQGGGGTYYVATKDSSRLAKYCP